MDTLTREQAIERIKDIVNGIEVDHLDIGHGPLLEASVDGAINELRAIFDIKEEELL